MLSCLSKILENIFKIRIDLFSQLNNIVPQYQFGFRRQHSTLHALSIFSNYITKALNNDRYSVCVSLDIENAFDRVWIHGLVYKLSSIFNFPKFIAKFVYNYLTSRTFQVSSICPSTGTTLISSVFVISAGTPQGSILGPVLYNIYLADFPSIQNVSNCKTLMFADDTLIYSSRSNAVSASDIVNHQLKIAHEYYNKWKIKINVLKTQAILIRRPATKKRIPDINLKIDNANLLVTKSFKYLGVKFQIFLLFLNTLKTLNLNI